VTTAAKGKGKRKENTVVCKQSRDLLPAALQTCRSAMVFFAGVTAVQSTLIADCYISHDPERGVVRNRSYVDAVRLYLGTYGQPSIVDDLPFFLDGIFDEMIIDRSSV